MACPTSLTFASLGLAYLRRSEHCLEGRRRVRTRVPKSTDHAAEQSSSSLPARKLSHQRKHQRPTVMRRPAFQLHPLLPPRRSQKAILRNLQLTRRWRTGWPPFSTATGVSRPASRLKAAAPLRGRSITSSAKRVSASPGCTFQWTVQACLRGSVGASRCRTRTCRITRAPTSAMASWRHFSPLFASFTPSSTSTSSLQAVRWPSLSRHFLQARSISQSTRTPPPPPLLISSSTCCYTSFLQSPHGVAKCSACP
mmetsp:Transcript_41437/g.102229  ORF Transcript_41437/g.102229 Transcript_41437/m.102229 type:complete len:254 (-) Transcript_41437:651-1412(-)